MTKRVRLTQAQEDELGRLFEQAIIVLAERLHSESERVSLDAATAIVRLQQACSTPDGWGDVSELLDGLSDY